MKAVFPPALFRRKGLKAVTPVIALVMLMLITVGSVGMAYTWFSGMMSSQTEKNIAIPIGGVQCINNRISAIITNAGANSNITDNDIVVADINGVNVRNTPFFGGFNLNGLVGYWRFEGDAKDYSTYRNDGALQGNPAPAQGRFGNAYNFDGLDDYVDAGSAASLRPDIVSIGAWIKYNGGDFTPLVTWGGYWPGVYLKWGTNPILVLNSENYRYFNGGNLWDGNWHNVVFVITGNGQNDINNAKMYIDGVSRSVAGTSNSNSPLPKSTPLVIGGTSYDFNGAIDEVAIWNRALSADEINQLNKTNAGNFTIAPQKAITLVNSYPVFAKGKYVVRVGTRNAVIERIVDCL